MCLRSHHLRSYRDVPRVSPHGVMTRAVVQMCCGEEVLRSSCAAGKRCCRAHVLWGRGAAELMCCGEEVLRSSCAAGKRCCGAHVLRG
ncbi:hypothetical protein GDO81_027752 [Engystomops pustulosus]|uniref:Uncharacterized protein n=1 Tax=Engystomops pustulosus TaxID=76066 RepID=A0AAV6YX99_ENGPU|nr:hypothetical protein GDO81_027752 [Engystomops pustulosus]